MAGPNWIISPSEKGWVPDQLVISEKGKSYSMDMKPPYKVTTHEHVHYAEVSSKPANPFSLQDKKSGSGEPVEKQYVEAGPLAEVLQDIVDGKPAVVVAERAFYSEDPPFYTIATGENVSEGMGKVWLPRE